MELDALHSGTGDGLGVYGGVDVGFHHADAQLVLQFLDGAEKRRRLAGAGRGHEIEKERFLLLETGADAVCLAVVVGKNAFLDLDDADIIHIQHASISFRLISLPCKSTVSPLPHTGHMRPCGTVA